MDIKTVKAPFVHDLGCLLLLMAPKTGDKALQLCYQPVLSISLSEKWEGSLSGFFDIKM